MKTLRTGSKIAIRLILLVFLCTSVSAQNSEPFSMNQSPLPPPTAPVNDYAGVLDEATKQTLNQKLKDFKAKTNPPVELAVAIVKTTGEKPIFDYSFAVARGWKIGSKAIDNPSALLFIAIEDRKYFTQVSKDLEDELPDGIVGSLQRQYLVPAFKQGNYAKGISDTLEAYMRTIEQRASGAAATPTPPGQTKPTESFSTVSLTSVVCCLIILVIILFIIFSRSSRKPDRRDRDRWGGGGFGGSGGGSSWIFIPGGGWSSGGSDSSSSSWGGGGGGSSDWGGFGGGGDFGGGGAGGDW